MDSLSGEGYLHANRNPEKFMEDPSQLQSQMGGEEKQEELEDQNANDETALDSDHASAGNSPPKEGNEGDTSFSSFRPGSRIKLKRNNSNSAEMMLQGVSSRSPTPSQQQLSSQSCPAGETTADGGYSLNGYFESCEECFVAGIRCVHCTAPLKLVPDGRGWVTWTRDADGGDRCDGRAARDPRHEWLVGRMNESLAKIDCAAATNGGGKGGDVVPRGGA
ncbi:hypothetical protein B0T20DRAFT_259453 [Sordaria brevicollis]|uniref:Uncharacterized protein n=1 Tax=Sordaria brevicollis TaxID=83679 RepID=A0AAE0P9U6_SORBR|nr:hypothetical protein B0T20DRAFT_259453 [Sordaria brevicollis]